MRELTGTETEQVAGAGIWKDIAVGIVSGAAYDAIKEGIKAAGEYLDDYGQPVGPVGGGGGGGW